MVGLCACPRSELTAGVPCVRSSFPRGPGSSADCHFEHRKWLLRLRLQGSCVYSLTVCKFKAHKRCAVRATNNCKWTTLASIGKDIIEDEDGVGAEGPLAPGPETLPPAPRSVLFLPAWSGPPCSGVRASLCQARAGAAGGQRRADPAFPPPVWDVPSVCLRSVRRSPCLTSGWRETCP